jgi:hypothetical protein
MLVILSLSPVTSALLQVLGPGVRPKQSVQQLLGSCAQAAHPSQIPYGSQTYLYIYSIDLYEFFNMYIFTAVMWQRNMGIA